VGGPNVITLTYVKPGWPAARAGLRVGDKVFFLVDTVPEMIEYRRYLAGQPLPVRIQRGSRVFYRSLVPIAPPVGVGDLVGAPDLWVAAFAAIVAWFGAGRRARLIAWLLLCRAIDGHELAGFYSPWPWLNEPAILLNAPATAMAIALLATISSTFGLTVSPLRRALEWSTYVVAVFGIGAVLVLHELIFITPWFDRFWQLANINDRGEFIGNMLAVACAVAALAAVRGEERQRAAWLLTPISAMFVASASVNVFTAFAVETYRGAQLTEAFTIVVNLAYLGLCAVMTYAILSRRLVDVAFVINQAAIFSGVSIIVVGLFMLGEWLLSGWFSRVTHATNIEISAALAVALGFSVRAIHARVERVLDGAFFRKRHDDEAAIRTFGGEASNATDTVALVRGTKEMLETHADAAFVTLIMDDGRGKYDGLSATDPAIVALRDRNKPLDLKTLQTQLEGEFAYPMIAGGHLVGVLVLGPKRSGESYAPDESNAIMQLAHEVGSTLHILTLAKLLQSGHLPA